MDVQQSVEAIAGQQAVGESETKAWRAGAAWLAWTMWALTVTLITVTMVLAYAACV